MLFQLRAPNVHFPFGVHFGTTVRTGTRARAAVMDRSVVVIAVVQVRVLPAHFRARGVGGRVFWGRYGAWVVDVSATGAAARESASRAQARSPWRTPRPAARARTPG